MDGENQRNRMVGFGRVVSASADEVMVEEYDLPRDEDVAAVYLITPATKLWHVHCAADLKPGDNVVLDYLETEVGRVVTDLFREREEAK